MLIYLFRAVSVARSVKPAKSERIKSEMESKVVAAVAAGIRLTENRGLQRAKRTDTGRTSDTFISGWLAGEHGGDDKMARLLLLESLLRR